MKGKTIITVLLLSTLQLVSGQEKMSPEDMSVYQNELMTSELQLSEEQQEKVADINLKYAKLFSELKAKPGSMFSKMGDFKKTGKEKNKELEAVLTESQMEKYLDDIEPKIKKHMRKNMKSK
ncbi:MAG: hypothetical protein AAF901_00290 [Bacteroidota bacterium]